MLYRKKETISLAPKVVETLLALIERRGEIVSKRELMKRLWADSFVEDSNLTQNIYLLRKTLGKGTDGRELIETFRRRGYRFTGEIKKRTASGEIENESRSEILTPETEEIGSENKNHLIKKNPNESDRKTFWKKRIFPLVTVLLILSIVIVGIFQLYKIKSGENFRPVNVQLKRLTPDQSTFNPAISPDGKYIAYALLEEKGSLSLWLRDMQSGEIKRLLPPFAKAYMGLQFSPDSKQLYYLTYNGIEPILSSIDLENGQTREVAGNVSVWFGLSPDGTQVAFVRDMDLVVAATDGSREERVIAKRDGKSKWFASQTAQPAWSPDGKKIVVSGGYADRDKKYSELLEINVNDGAEKKIQTPFWEKIGSVVWTKDDSGLYVTAREAANQPNQIFFLSFENSGVQRITNDLHNYNSLSLTTDSRSLVTEQVAGKSDIWIAEGSDLNQIRRITFEDEETTGVNGLAFMPDGRIVYTSPRSGNLDLWIMNADGTNQKQLTSNMSGWNIRPRPTADGKYIVFQSFYNNRNQILRMDADGKNIIQLTNDNESYSFPDVSPDGQWVYCTMNKEEETSIWKVSINGGTTVRFAEENKILGASISPNGKLIAANYEWNQDSSLKVVILSAENGKILKRFDIAAFRRILKWSPDSKSIIYIQRNSANLYEQPIKGGEPRQLTKFDLEQTWNFAFSFDHQQTAFVRGTINTESVLINLK